MIVKSERPVSAAVPGKRSHKFPSVNGQVLAAQQFPRTNRQRQHAGEIVRHKNIGTLDMLQAVLIRDTWFAQTHGRAGRDVDAAAIHGLRHINDNRLPAFGNEFEGVF